MTRSGTDVDKDGLGHDTERRRATDPCHYDTDGDGLPDSWEVRDPSVPGAGFDLDGNGSVDVPSKLVFGGGFDEPNPLRKDLYIEVDSYDCNIGGCPPFDPMIHGLDAQSKTDVERMLNSFDMSLRIVDDEHVAHMPNCDQPPALLRGGPNPAVGTRTSARSRSATSSARRSSRFATRCSATPRCSTTTTRARRRAPSTS